MARARGFDCQRAAESVSMPQMIKALFLIFEPSGAWENVAEARRGLAFILVFYLLPMLLILAAAEGFGLMHWGMLQVNSGLIKKLTTNEAVVYETAQSLVTLLVIAAAAFFIKSLADTFHSRHNYTQSFTVVIYALSPLFLVGLFNMFPTPSVWLVWAVGLLLALKTLYHGVPIVMQADPTHAFGLYFMSALVVVALTGAERFFTMWYLTGHFVPLANSVSNLAAKLPF
jgi:hypothetical protein